MAQPGKAAIPPPRRRRHDINYRDAKVRREILIRQRRELWTPEQVASFARHFRLKPGMKLLDAGCGYGYIMRTYGPYCMPRGELVGLDREKKLLATAARFCRREGLAKVARFVRGDICAQPFPDNIFDISIAHVVFCHLAEPEKALDELIRVTKPGGCVAVFDNAIGGIGGGSNWSSCGTEDPRELLLYAEVGMRMLTGRTELGQGSFSVGCHIPAWMEARGLNDVDARTNERVSWIAPPYRSPAQQTAHRNVKERIRERVGTPRITKADREQMKAGGLSEHKMKTCHELNVRERQRFIKAVRDGTAAFAGSGPFWCIWGFKP